MVNILIFEPQSSGHRMVYVRYLLRAIQRRGSLHAILVTSEKALFDPYVISMASEFGAFLSVEALQLPRSRGVLRVLNARLASQFNIFKVFRATLEELLSRRAIDYIFVPFLDDYFLLPAAFIRRPFRQIPFGGIAIRPRFHLRPIGAEVPRRWIDLVEEFAYRRLLRSDGLDRLFSIDPYLERYLSDGKVTSVPDPSDLLEVVPAQTNFGLSSDAVVLLVYGYIDHRKALDRLFAAMVDSRVDQRLIVLLAGKQDPQIGALLAGDEAQQLRAQGRLVEAAWLISDAEESAAFRRADIVWCYYPRNYCSSGALVRAGQCSRPVIVTREGLVGLLVSELGMGCPVGEHDHEGLVLALARLGGDAALRGQLGRAGFEYFSKSTVESFGDLIIGQIARTLER